MKKITAILITFSLMLTLAFGSLAVSADEETPAVTPAEGTEQVEEGGESPGDPGEEVVPGDEETPGEDPEQQGDDGQETPSVPQSEVTDPSAQDENEDESAPAQEETENKDSEEEKNEASEPEEKQEAEDPALLDEAAADIITAQPKDASVNYPGSVKFTVSAADSAKITGWQWYCKDQTGRTFKLDGETAVTDTLVRPSTRQDDSGLKYYCVLTDQDGKTVTSGEAALTVANAEENKAVLYVGEYALESGERLDLSTAGLGKGKVTFKDEKITFNNVEFSNEKFSCGTMLSEGVGITLYCKGVSEKKTYTLILKGENVIENKYLSEDKTNGGTSFELSFPESTAEPALVIKKGTGSLEIKGGTCGIETPGSLEINSDVKVTIDSKKIKEAVGISAEGGLTVKEANVTVDVATDEAAYGILCGDSEFTLTKKKIVDSKVKKGVAFASATGSEGDSKREYESGYSASHITLKNNTTCLLPKSNVISLTSGKGQEKTYAYYETFYASNKTANPATEVKLQGVDAEKPVYAFDSSSDDSWKKGSSAGLNATVTRKPDNSTAFSHFTGIKVDGKTVADDQYTASSGSVKLTLNAGYLEKLDAGNHTLTAVFNDGTAETEFAVKEETITINVRGNVVTAVYNGEEQAAKGCRASSDSSLFDITKIAFAEGKSGKAAGTDVGTYQMGLTSDYFVYNDDSVEAVFNVTDGYIEITPAPLTIKTGSASKVYDGKPLTSIEASAAGLVNGETVTLAATGSQTQVGESRNTYAITWNTAKESNYSVSEALGTLTVRSGGSNPGGGTNGSGGNGTSGSAANAKTGDTANMTLWIFLIVAAGLAAGAAGIAAKRRK